MGKPKEVEEHEKFVRKHYQRVDVPEAALEALERTQRRLYPVQPGHNKKPITR